MQWQPIDEPDAAQPIADDAEQHVDGFVAGDVWGILSALVLVIFVGLQAFSAYLLLTGAIALDDLTLRAVDLWVNSAILLIGFGALPFLWIATTRRGGWEGTIRYFQLRRPWTDLPIGIGVAVGLVMLILIAGLIMLALDIAPENPALDDFQAIVNWPLIIAVSLSAAVGEEILFRGVLQKYTGMWGQAALFGLMHVYQGWYGVVLTGLLGLLFGYIVKKRWGLWIPIVAHFFYDFIQLTVLMLAPELP